VIEINTPDYIVLRYIWDLIDGVDLDTMTEFIASGISGLDYVPVGWKYQYLTNNVLDILRWGGDNTGSGQENILIDLTQLKSHPELIETSLIDIYGSWFSLKGERHTCTIELKAYMGGTISKVGYQFLNTGGTLIYSSDSTVKSVDAVDPPFHPTFNCDTFRTGGYTKLGRMEYKKSTGKATLIF